MPEQLTNDSRNRAKLILNATGRLGGVDWSATVTDGNASFGGYGFSGATLTVSVNGGNVVSESNRSYDFGGSTGSNTVVSNAFFPRTGKSFSGSVGLNPGTYTVSGTFTTTGTVGTASISFSVTVPAPTPTTPSWSTGTSLPTATRGTSYSATVSASPVTSYSAVSSSGQTGGLSVSSNVISGTPTTVGTANFTIRANNSGSTADRTFSIVINPALPAFSDSTLANGRVGSLYSDGVTASEAATYSVRNPENTGAGALPPGLTLNTSTGTITGTPTLIGSYSFIIRATNVTGSTNTATRTLVISPPGNRHNGTSMATDLTTARRFNGTNWVNITTFKRFDGTNWVDIVN